MQLKCVDLSCLCHGCGVVSPTGSSMLLLEQLRGSWHRACHLGLLIDFGDQQTLTQALVKQL
jgi:hypothetical protein